MSFVEASIAVFFVCSLVLLLWLENKGPQS